MPDGEEELIELEAREEHGRVVFEVPEHRPRTGLLAQARRWLTLVVAAGVGVALFLFFVTVVLWVVLPLTALLLVWPYLQRWRRRSGSGF